MKEKKVTCWTCARNVSNWASVQQTLPVTVGHKLWIFDESNSSGCEAYQIIRGLTV